MKPCQEGKIKKLLFIGVLIIGICFGFSEAYAASGTVLNFDGNDYLTAADNAVFDQANQLSWSVWVKPDITPSGDAFIIYSANRYYLKLNSSNQIVGAIYYSSAWRTITSSAITIGEWTHIEMTYNKDAGGADELKLYIDAVLSAIADHSTAIADTNTALYIGSDSTPANYFDGKIDDIRLYQYARTADEIRLDYNAGFAARFGKELSSCSEDPGSCMTKGLVGYWGMDEGTGQKAYDGSGNSNNGTLGSSASPDSADPKWTTGQGRTSSGSALRFDGVNDYVNAGNGASLQDTFSTGSFTVEAWVNVKDPTPGNGAEIVQKYNPGFLFRVSASSRIGLYITGTGGSTNFLYGSTLALNTWYHVVAVRDTSSAKAILYTNGVYVTSMSETAGNIYTTYPLYFGKTCCSVTNFNGLIDEVRIYNRALSEVEVRYHYNRGGPVAEWKFNEGSGTTTYDSTSNNNDGTLNLGTSGNTTTSNAWVQGKYGSGISFDGIDDYVQATVSQTKTTYSLWIKPANGVWEHVVKIGSTYYVNGSPGTPTAFPIYVSGNTIQIGKTAASTYFNGFIDEVRIYNYARTPAQILQDYNAGYGIYFK